tara:strand:- start:1392 stop:2801 length:1410 start_codon:yes stop_codon:yes gene_type:complete
MALNREERKLLHQKSKQPTFGSGKPDNKQGNEGDISFRKIEGSGTVEYLKQNNEWVAIASQGDMPKSRDVTRTPSGGGSAENHSHGEFIKKDGSVAYTGNQSFGTNNITNVGTLDVDGATTLDRVTIDTADGAFAVSGANPINLTTTGTNKITLTSGNDIDITPTGDLDIDANNVTVDTAREYTGTIVGNYLLTCSANSTISATGSAANTVLIQNTNNHGSSFLGVHIKTDSGAATSGYNKILIECDNVAAKGADYGVDIRSENNIRIRAESANNGNVTGLLMRATGPIDIGVGSSITPHTSNNRVKVHGIFETGTLWRDSDTPIVMDKGTIEGGSATQEYTKFEAIDTQKLIRAYTYKANATTAENDYLTIVPDASADEVNGTVWLVTVVFNYGVNEGITSGYCYRMNNTNEDPEDHGYLIQHYNSTGSGGEITWSASDGIRWRNIISGSISVAVKASAQRLQSGNDF